MKSSSKTGDICWDSLSEMEQVQEKLTDGHFWIEHQQWLFEVKLNKQAEALGIEPGDYMDAYNAYVKRVGNADDFDYYEQIDWEWATDEYDD